jgi:DNA-binding Xre family transcriptional regulator
MVPILGRRSGAGILLAMTKPFNPPRRPVIIACAASAARMRGRALVAWNLRRIRVNRGLSQKKLAFDSGIDRSYVGGLERQEENPTVDFLDRLAKALSIHL